MAQPVKKRWSAFAFASGCLICQFAMMPAANAEQLRDPTVLPDQLTQSGDATVASGPVLQSVLISPKRKVAVISGQTVKLGEKFGDATLVRITEGEAVLRTGSELQTLRLFPSIGKRLTSGRADRYPDNRK